ncbi:unnamed protein product [Acanthoscelides obtectus]|uniref:Uncharacterized protein n=1 Tax=Acanthoscelides obtectus TaxID=200917 RepID=A0A9P0KMA7_ACAOB|nr:unnamed protein product [Acanthoscelides obtectus]CAK1681685.1 hypothetical protein AOBTE_LOCUS33213 [Acanthoscelides obtectus]
MVRITAQPDQWEKVHKLLRNIDDDLVTSRDVIRRLEAATNTLKKIEENLNHDKKNLSSMKSKGRIKENKKPTRNYSHDNGKHRAIQTNFSDVVEEKEWPSSSNSSVQFVNISKVSSDKNNENQSQMDSKPVKSTYQKNFAYHRVTGIPMSLNRPPKAYMAVSVPDPQPQVPLSSSHTSNEEDAILENELHQLKPWKPKHEVENNGELN